MLGATLAAALLCSAAQEPPVEGSAVQGAGYARSILFIPQDGRRLALRDMNGDGRLDLLVVEPEGFGVRLLRGDGTYPDAHDAFLPHPSERMAWDIADLDGDGRTEIVVLLEGTQVRAFGLAADGSFGAGRPLVAARGYLPRGRSRMSFVRDVDGDGRPDLVVPGAGRYLIHLAREDGGYAPALEVAYEAELAHSVGDPQELGESFGQTLRVPWFRIEDVDGDGLADLVSETPDEVFFHLAAPEISAEPTWRIDLAALRAERPARAGFDASDVLANLDAGVGWRIEDLDGSYPKDLVLQVGATFRVYLGAARAGPSGPPDQILRLSGSLLHFFLRDVTGDALPDLQLLRGPRISLGTIVRWLILPGRLDFDLFTYENQGGTFGRRPARQNRVSIEIPRLLSFLKELDELRDLVEAQREIPARRFAALPGGPERDVLDHVDGSLAVYLGRATGIAEGEAVARFDGDIDRLLEELVLLDLDRMGDAGAKSIDLGRLREWRFSEGAALRAACAGLEPDRRIPLEWRVPVRSLHALDLDGDGAVDFVVVGEELGELGQVHVVQVLVDRR